MYHYCDEWVYSIKGLIDDLIPKWAGDKELEPADQVVALSCLSDLLHYPALLLYVMLCRLSMPKYSITAGAFS